MCKIFHLFDEGCRLRPAVATPFQVFHRAAATFKAGKSDYVRQ